MYAHVPELFNEFGVVDIVKTSANVPSIIQWYPVLWQMSVVRSSAMCASLIGRKP